MFTKKVLFSLITCLCATSYVLPNFVIHSSSIPNRTKIIEYIETHPIASKLDSSTKASAINHLLENIEICVTEAKSRNESRAIVPFSIGIHNDSIVKENDCLVIQETSYKKENGCIWHRYQNNNELLATKYNLKIEDLFKNRHHMYDVTDIDCRELHIFVDESKSKEEAESIVAREYAKRIFAGIIVIDKLE